MESLSPEAYVPAFGFLVVLIASLSTTVKLMWSAIERERLAKDAVQERLNAVLERTATEQIKVITINSEALHESSEAIDRLASYAFKDQERPRSRSRRGSNR